MKNKVFFNLIFPQLRFSDLGKYVYINLDTALEWNFRKPKLILEFKKNNSDIEIYEDNYFKLIILGFGFEIVIYN